MKVKLITISIILLLAMVFACGCIPVMEKLGLVSPTDEEQLSPEKGGPPDGLVKVLIGFKEKPGAAQQAMVKGLGGKIKYTYNIIPAIAASVPEVAIEALKKNPNITNVELDSKVFALGQTLPWGVDRIDAEVVHASGNKGAEVQVAIIDTGIDYKHPNLDDNYYGGWDFVNNDGDPMDDNGHGTHVAGIVAALDNGDGVVGVAPEAKLYALKVLNENGEGYVSDVIFAIQWASDPDGDGSADDRLDIINMSFGADIGNIFFRWACNLAYRDGLLLIAAAGNYGAVCYPAAYSRVIAVSATDYDYMNGKDILANFSSVGPEVELAAPGVNINSALLGGGYITHDGTSMASPHVAGTAALVWAENPSWRNTDVRKCLQNSAEDINLLDTEQGYGLVDAENAVLGTTKGNNLPTQQATGTITGTVTNISTGDTIEGAKVTADVYSDFTKNDGTYTLNDMPVGIYTVTASAIGYNDESLTDVVVLEGNTTVVDFTLTPETTPPAKVTSLTVITVSCVQLDLEWGANTEIGLDYYNVYRSTDFGGSYDLLASPTTNSYSDVELTTFTTYYYIVSAVDVSGNEGEASDEASGTTNADDLGPLTSDVVAYPNPTNGATSVTLTAYVSDATTGNSNIAAAEYTVGVDGAGTSVNASDGAFDSPAEGVTVSIDVSGWTVDQYTLYVHGKDAAGNWGATEYVVLDVKKAPSNIMYVESIVFSSKVAGPNKFLYTTVKVVDGGGSALGGVGVVMTLDWDKEGDGTINHSWNFAGDTDVDGMLKFTLKKAPSGLYTATVTGLTLSGYDWEIELGVVTSDPYTLN